MVIKASTAAEVRSLMAHLASADPVVREGAVARLTVIGSRAVDRLLALYSTEPALPTRLAILQTLEGIGDPRSLAVARGALAEGGDVGVAGAAGLRRLLASRDDRTASDALDALMSAALDERADRRTRLAALEALQDCPAGVREPVAAALRRERNPILDEAGTADPPADALWADALGGRLPAAASTLHVIVSAQAATTPLTALRRLVDAVRAREGSDPSPLAWTALRGSLHQALALRGSRVALYDLRETIEGSDGPLPPSYLAAMQALGDASCLEGLVAAWARAGDPQWREQLGLAVAAVARRGRVSARHAVARRIAARWPEAAAVMGAASESASVSTPSRTRPRRSTAARTARRSR